MLYFENYKISQQLISIRNISHALYEMAIEKSMVTCLRWTCIIGLRLLLYTKIYYVVCKSLLLF